MMSSKNQAQSIDESFQHQNKLDAPVDLPVGFQAAFQECQHRFRFEAIRQILHNAQIVLVRQLRLSSQTERDRVVEELDEQAQNRNGTVTLDGSLLAGFFNKVHPVLGQFYAVEPWLGEAVEQRSPELPQGRVRQLPSLSGTAVAQPDDAFEQGRIIQAVRPQQLGDHGVGQRRKSARFDSVK